jgi:hypothetical protein
MTNTLILIDARNSGYQKLLDSLPQVAEVALLSPDEDGLAQITSALTGRSNLDAIHLIRHGSEGALYLGGSVLNTTTLAGYTAQLQQLGQALFANGDLLLYGCNVASGDAGMDFITRLSVITGADVAASTDLTGAAELGGKKPAACSRLKFQRNWIPCWRRRCWVYPLLQRPLIPKTARRSS